MSLVDKDALKSRITVVEYAYLQQPGEEATCVEARFARWLKTDELPYKCRLKVGQEWKPIDTGWLGSEKLGMLMLSNEEGTDLQKIPTPEEKQEMDSRVLEIGMAGMVGEPGRKFEVVLPFGLLLPNEGCRLNPYEVRNLRVRCQSGTARCTVNAFPI